MEFVLLPLIVFLTVLTVAIVLMRRHDQASQRQVFLTRMASPAPEDIEEIDITRRIRIQESGLVGQLLSRIKVIQRKTVTRNSKSIGTN